ncbi:hypothetical protein CRE_02659 [Caenorhabditis remanei]|uniref:Uncharacterized protein n=1 Tax=Caenorhabditis remanei TaxID=31234 RepID=E3NG27_CAERE|nr:hypothetical protein CRE_02659 [Caenorhabditis remanei]
MNPMRYTFVLLYELVYFFVYFISFNAYTYVTTDRDLISSNMNLTTEQPRLFYVPIYLHPEFQSVSYNFDFVSVIVIASFICFIPTIYSTVRMVLYRHPQNSSTDIHPYVYKSFICMQVSEVASTVTDFGVVRIAWTTAMTSYYSTAAPDSPLIIFVAAFHSLAYLSQLLIVLFCLMRLLVFMNNQNRCYFGFLIFKTNQFRLTV